MAKLTPRQIECLQRIACGETSAQIAAALGLSVRTVDHYVGAACSRFGVRSRAQAVAIAIQQNIILPPPDPGPA
jgi:DNA-binding CsgD family transcriptional regulator